MQLTTAGDVAWQPAGHRRLGIAVVLAAILVSGLVAVLPPLDFQAFRPWVSLLVTFVRREPAPDAAAPEVPSALMAEPATVDPFAIAQPETGAAAAEPMPGAAPPPAAVTTAGPAPDTDMRSVRQGAVDRYVDGLADIVSPSPAMDEKRRRLAGQYQPPTREPPKPIWENVETDQLGRKVLRDGNCYSVLDDPNVTRRYQFETFDRYMVHCSPETRVARELPWVEELRARYFYLAHPDGTAPDAAGPLQVSASALP